jgi:hypothetical protein
MQNETEILKMCHASTSFPSNVLAFNPSKPNGVTCDELRTTPNACIVTTFLSWIVSLCRKKKKIFANQFVRSHRTRSKRLTSSWFVVNFG